MALSTEDAAWLAQLKAARQRLILGEKSVKVSSFGRATDYTPADITRIEAEIERLEALAGGERSINRRGRIGISGWLK